MNNYEDFISAVKVRHESAIEKNRRIFEDEPPVDRRSYVYIYYTFNRFEGDPIYVGMTSNAAQRAAVHFKKAPWASWIEDVEYRYCRNREAAYRLETSLIRELNPLCRIVGTCRVRHFHGEDWSSIDTEHKVNHVTGHCKLPGGVCDVSFENFERLLHITGSRYERERLVS